MVRRQIYLTTRQVEQLKVISKVEGICVSELIRRILDNYLESKAL